LAVAGTRGLAALFPPAVLGVDHITVSWRVAGFTLGASLAAALIFGIAPALRGAGADLRTALHEGARGSTGGARGSRLRRGFVVGELAMALVLLIAAGLLVKGFLRLRDVPLGFDPDGVLTFDIALSAAEYPDSLAVVGLQQTLLGRLRAMPEVRSAGATDRLPMTGNNWTYYTVQGRPAPPPAERSLVGIRAVLPGYAATMDIHLLRGRLLTAEDRMGTPPVVVINRTLAEREWPSSDPIGQRIVFSSGPHTIVGVVADTRDSGPDDPAPPMAYTSDLQGPERRLAFVLRTDADPSALTGPVRAAVAALDAQLPVYEVRTMRRVVDDSLKSDEIMGRLLGVFAAIALLLAVVGVYGVMAYSVARRTGEVGVRMALGASRGDILRLITGQGLMLATVGIALGLGLAALATRALSSFLFGVSAFDPVIFGGVSVLLGLAAVLASLLPARRAASIDPQVALRAE
jgi:putative ABC transport system permease protein